jgi:hypothetical protein
MKATASGYPWDIPPNCSHKSKDHVRMAAGWHIFKNDAPLALRPHFSASLPSSTIHGRSSHILT